ncbi:MAG: class I SAM-dependent methyltransferase [Actinomycetota bacterium]|nr:class I SAM-dependent methyltransferase [Actinomycetota bacterium]
MSQTDTSLEERTGAFVERIFGSLVGATDLFVIDVGRRLGLYESLAEGSATPSELAQRTGCAERYVREWLEHQVVAGILEVDDATADASTRRYSIPEAHRSPLIDSDSLAYVGAMAYTATALARPVAWMVEAFQSGDGVPYERYGEEGVQVQGALTRPMFASLLTTEWVPALPGLEARLNTKGARVADIACGIGLAAIEIAKQYPNVTVDGFDNDETSIALARKNAAEAGVADRVSFEVRDGADLSSSVGYNLITIFEAIHDMSQPVDVLAAAKGLLAHDGWFIVADENTGDSFAEPGPFDNFFYGVSVLWCLPQSLAEQPSEAIGTVIRASTMESLATRAGFSKVEIAPIENDFWRFYRLVP